MERYRTILALAYLCGGDAWASTDCVSTIASIAVETGSPSAGYVVTLGTGLSFAMTPKSASYGEILSMSQLALTTASGITARFATNNVNCNRSARRTDLIALVIGHDQTATTSTPSMTSVPVTTPPAVLR